MGSRTSVVAGDRRHPAAVLETAAGRRASDAAFGSDAFGSDAFGSDATPVGLASPASVAAGRALTARGGVAVPRSRSTAPEGDRP